MLRQTAELVSYRQVETMHAEDPETLEFTVNGANVSCAVTVLLVQLVDVVDMRKQGFEHVQIAFDAALVNTESANTILFLVQIVLNVLLKKTG